MADSNRGSSGYVKGTYSVYSTRKTALALAVVVVLLASTLGIALLGGPSSSASGAGKQKITYYANNGTGDSYEIEYSGIASTEYNPEFWEGSVDGVDVENWEGATSSRDSYLGTITLNVYSFRTLSGSTARIDLDSDIVFSLETSTISGGNWQSGWSAEVTLQTDTDGSQYIELRSIDSWGSINKWSNSSTSINLRVMDSVKKVFAGWAESPTATSADYLPGDVVTSDVDELYAVWITPDRFIQTGQYAGAELDYDSQRGTYSTSMFPTLSTDSNGILVPFTYTNSYNGTWYYGDGRSERTMFGTIYYLKSGTTYYTNSVTLPTGSYRSIDPDNRATLALTSSTQCKIGTGGVVIDNVYMSGSGSTGENHGDGSKTAYIANGNILILGTGITLPAKKTSNVGSGNPVGPQVIGGSSSGTLYPNYSKKMPFGTYDLSGNAKNYVNVDIATYVLIHSGIYYNVVAGGVGGNVGSSSSPASTYLVMKGGTVLDTLIGGCGNRANVYGESGSTAEAGEFQGGTFVYLLGADMPGDDYEDRMSGFYDYSPDRGMYVLPESTILEGGCSDTRVYGSTHVFLSGDTTVYDVQAAGRRGGSETTFSYLEITGDAVVRHIACGTITDGNSNNVNCAHGVRVVVDGDAKVATLLGGGYDTWSLPNSPSMTAGTVSVEVYGGTVGYVYGGGFRGSLGTTNTSVTVNVNVIGGTVLGDVYGGGRGGIEKVLHNTTGTLNASGSGFSDSAGKSYIYGDVTVTVGHAAGIFADRTADVKGSVYGGGESVPIMKSYTYSGRTFSSFGTANPNVAAVFGTTSVTVLDSAQIGGSVYGSGRGISYGADGKITAEDNLEYSTMYLFGYSCSAFSPVNVAWMANNYGGTATYYSSTEKDLKTFAEVQGSSSVRIAGGTVGGDVYGGGAYGITTQKTLSDKVICTVSVESGTINGSVYGGGVGRAGETSVFGSTSVSVSGGRVEGSVYGGACYGIVGYNAETVITGGVVGGSVYGGGYGVNGYKAVSGTRKMGLKDTLIVGNVYGGSALGNDGSDTSNGSDVYLIISDGVTIGGSVYGGGFQGSTYGSTTIYIGCDYDGSLAIPSVPMSQYVDHRITITGSVYAGGDVGDISEDMQAYTTALVHGDGKIILDGQNVPISIAGSLMGSGNSCLTEGRTSITVNSFNNLSAMEGIHRADNVMLYSTTLVLNGRGTVNSDGETKLYSLYGIGNLILQNASQITVYSAVDNIGTYRSLNKDGSATTPMSPLNAIVFGSGDIIKFRTTDGGISYSPIFGNTIIATLTSDSTYGGYILGALSSTGGFVIMHSGTYTAADRTDYDLCRCWFISGTMRVNTTMTMYYSGTGATSDSSVGAEIDMNMLLGTTDMVYTGGSYIESNPNRYSFSDTPTTDVGKFNFLVGSNDPAVSNNMILNNGNGVYFTPSDDGRYTTSGEGGELQRTSSLYLKFSGTVRDETLYLGYVTLYFQEVSYIEYETAEGTEQSQIIVNYTEIRVDLYVRGAGGLGDITVTIGTTRGVGSTDLQIPPVNTYSGAQLYVMSMTSLTGGNDSITVSAEKNLNNTSGWTYLRPGTTLSPGFSGNILLGTLQGGYVADMKFAVSGFGSPTAQEYAFECRLHMLDGTNLDFTVTVRIEALEDVGVTFVDGQQDYSIKYYFGYGYTLQSSDCPPTLNNFIGWYTDPSFNNIYNFKAPLTTDLTLYARYALTVTFDNGDGTTSFLNVQEVAGGIRISPPTEPVRTGYEFSGWYKDRDYAVAWDFDTDLVTDSMTLYAKWSGVTVNVTFQYLDENAKRQYVKVDGSIYTLSASYGSIFGLLDEEFSAQEKKDITYLDRAKDIVSGLITEEFIRWSAPVNGLQVAVYDDTLVTFYEPDGHGGYCVVLTAITSSVALRIDTDANSSDLTGEVEPPSTFLVYPTSNGTDSYGDYYTFEFDLNGATRTGWSLLGWALTPDAEEFLGSGTTVKLTAYYNTVNDKYVVDRFVYENGSTVTELPAGGVINDASNPYVITYYAIWSQIAYSVTVIPSSHGTIDAYFGGEVGTTFTAYYGDVITLRFTPNEGYNFYSWFVNGEGSFGDRYSPSSTFVVTGNSSIYCVATGPQVVRLLAYFNGGVQLDTEPGALFSSAEMGDYDMTFEGWFSDGESLFGQYYAMVAPGTYGVCLVGQSGTPYKFQELTVSESVHSTTIYVITVDNGVEVGTTGQTAGATSGLKDFPEFVIPGTSIDIEISAGYVFDITVSYGTVQDNNNGTTSVDQVLSFTVPADAIGPISITGKLTVAERNVIIHLRTMDIGGQSYSDYISEAIVMPVAATSYTGNYYLRVLPGFTVNAQLSSEQSDITSFSISGGYVHFTLDAGDPIVVCYDRLYAQAQISVDMLATVHADMSAWTQGTSGTMTTYTKTVWYDEVISLPEVSRDGFTMNGWNMSGTSGHIADGKYRVTAADVSSPTNVLRFTADLSDTIHILTLITQYGTFPNGTSRYSVGVNVGENLQDYLETPVLSASESGRYEFAGWANIVEEMPNHDVTYTAVWNLVTQTLTFTALDDHVHISATDNSLGVLSGSNVPHGDYVTVTIVFDDGYSIKDYSPTGTFIGAPVQGEDRQHYSWSFYMTDDVEIGISSAPSMCRVFFVVNGVLDPTLTLNYSKYADCYFDKFDKPGYKVSKWYTDAQCTVEAAWNTDEGYYHTQVISDVTFYTSPQANTYTVVFDANGGTGTTADQQFTYGISASLNRNGFSYENRVFLGWSDSRTGALLYAPGATVSNLTSVDNSTVTLYAVWATLGNVSVKYDGVAHGGVLSASPCPTAITVYYASVNLTHSNYLTSGTTDMLQYTAAGSHIVYFYLVAEAGSGTSIVTGSFTVYIEKRAVTITSGSSTRAYDGTELTNSNVTYSGDGFVSGQGVKIDPTGSQTDVGSSPNTFAYEFTISTDPGNYDITVQYGTLTVTAKSDNIDVAAELKVTYGDSGSAVSATSPAGTTLYYTSSDESVVVVDRTTGAITIVSAGTATITVTMPAYEGYEESTVDVNVTVAKKTLTVNGFAIDTTKTYDGTNTANITSRGTLAGIIDPDDVSLTSTAFYESVNASESVNIQVVHTLSGTKAGNYSVDEPDPVAGSISKRSVTITSGSSTRAYDGTPLTNSNVTYSGDGFVSGQGVKIDPTGSQTVVGESDNEFDYRLTSATISSNYEITKVFGKLEITVRLIVVPEARQSYQYTGQNVSATAVIPTSTYYTISGSGCNVGDYVAVAKLKDTVNTAWNTNPVTTADQNIIWHIVKNVIVGEKFTVNTEPERYTSQAIEKTVESTYILGTDYTVMYSNNIDVGTAIITIKGAGGYGGSLSYTFRITPALVTVSIGGYNVYDGTTHSASYDISGLYGSDVGSVSVAFSSNGTAIAAGTYTAVVSGLVGAKAANYMINSDVTVTGDWHITARAAYIIAGSASGAYGSKLTCTDYRVLGILPGELSAFTFEVIGSQSEIGSSANTVTYTAAESVLANYDIRNIDGTLTVYPVFNSIVSVSAAAETVVTYDANGGDGEMDDTHSTVAVFALRPNGFTMAGHMFEGWSLVPGGQRAYMDGATVPDVKLGVNLTLYAVLSV